MARYTRRQLLASCSVATVGSLAGCASTDSGSEPSADDPIAQSSFFVLGDFTAEVAGETARAETLVPVGQHGHGWEPGPQIQGTVLESDLFVYVLEGFQPWADDLVTSLRDDEAGVHVVAPGERVDLLESDHGHGQHDDSEHDDSADNHEHGDEDHAEHGDEGHADDHSHEGDHDHDEETDAHGHDHGPIDPHFWLDPTRAKQAVDAIEDAFATVDSENAATYADNADAYRSRLDALDETFRSTLEDATRDVVLLAGHDAFAYLGHRYGFEIETLTGLSPDEQPTPADIERAQTLIDDHDLEYVCADPLEPQDAAEQLVAETDAAEILPLTPIPGRNQAWADDDWGYAEIMEELNLETLATALEAR